MTFLEMISALNSYLQDSSPDGAFTLAEKKSALNKHNRRIVRRLFDMGRWRKKSAIITTQGTKQEYDLPADFRASLRLLHTDGVEIDRLGEYDPGFTDETGEPLYYYVFGLYSKTAGVETFPQIGFWPIPDSVYRITLEYSSIPVELSADADISAVPADFHDMVVVAAAIELESRNGVSDLVKLWERRSAEDWNDLIISMDRDDVYDRDIFVNRFSA